MTENEQKAGRWRPWVINLAAIVAILLVAQWWQSRDVARGVAPTLAGRLLNGEWVALKDFRGEPVLVHFWATWCPVCRFEESTIASLHQSHRVLTVAIDSGGPKALQSYLAQQGLDFPVMPDQAGDLARLWGVAGVPASFVVDPNGAIAYATVGYTSSIGLRIRLWLAGL